MKNLIWAFFLCTCSALWILPQDTVAQKNDYKIIVSIEERWLWVTKGGEVILSEPAAVGMNKSFTYQGQTWRFATPRGVHKVIDKKEKPIWTPPAWDYYETANRVNVRVAHLSANVPLILSDSSTLEVMGDSVVRRSYGGVIWSWPVDKYIELEGNLFIPPTTTKQAKVAEALGPYALYLGDGYMIHGTNSTNTNSVGQAVSHGCVRVENRVVTLLYELVPVGTPVEIN